MIHYGHYFSVQCLSYEANYSHCFLRKLSLKWNFSLGVSNDTLVYSFAPQTESQQRPATATVPLSQQSTLRCEQKVCTFHLIQSQLFSLPCQCLMAVQLAFRGCHACELCSFPCFTSFFFFWSLCLSTTLYFFLFSFCHSTLLRDHN